MNAYELADELEGFNFLDGDIHIAPYQKQADMLRQQADRIAELEKQSKPIGVYDGKDLHIYTPQTKPLSDEEIKAIAAQNRTDLSIPAYISFARAIEERHGIK